MPEKQVEKYEQDARKEVKAFLKGHKFTQEIENLLVQVFLIGSTYGLEQARKIYNE